MADIVIIHVLIVASIVLFGTERVRADLVSVLVLASLMVLGLFRDRFPPANDVFVGFSNPATVTVASMFILSGGLVRTGAVNWISGKIVGAAKDDKRSVVVILLITVGALSAFVNNTATIAVFLPIALTISRQYDIGASKILMPLSFIAIVGGTCTLIGTSTNVIVSEISAEHGIGQFPMFEMAKLGLPFFVVALAYLIWVAPRILPVREHISALTRKYRMSDYLSGLMVTPNSTLLGRTLVQARLSERYDVNVLQITRGEEVRWFGLRDTPLETGDRLLVRGDADDIVRLADMENLSLVAEAKFADENLASDMTALVECVISPSSSLVGSSLKEADFRRRYGVFALAVRKHGRTIRRKIAEIRLEPGDTLLLQGRRAVIDTLFDTPDFLVLREIDVPRIRRKRSLLAIGIVALVVIAAALHVFPIMVAAVLGALAMVGTGCVSLKEAYETIDWMVIFLLAGMIPLGLAMETTGTAGFLVGAMMSLSDVLGPTFLVSLFYLLASLLTAVMSNNATAVLLAPIGIGAAAELGASPWPFMMAIAFGASAAFATPVGYQTNLMVYGPGRYRYTDFLRAGIPLNVLFWVIATLAIPRIWPL